MTLQGIRQVLMGSGAGRRDGRFSRGTTARRRADRPRRALRAGHARGMERRPGRLRPRHRGPGAAGGAAVGAGQLHLVRDALLARGFAVASSSFSGNGFMLKDAAQRTHQLTGLFTARFSRPRRVLLAGHSLGSMAALQLAETYPDQYDGALVMCGFVGGTTREIEYMATARLVYDYLFPGVIPGRSSRSRRPGLPARARRCSTRCRRSLDRRLRTALQDVPVCGCRRSSWQQRRPSW